MIWLLVILVVLLVVSASSPPSLAPYGDPVTEYRPHKSHSTEG